MEAILSRVFLLYGVLVASAGPAFALSFEEILFKIRPGLHTELKREGWSLNKADAGKGHLSVEGPFDGRDEYFLFRGSPSDIVIHDAQAGEDLELKQGFDIFLVTDGAIRHVKRKDVFPERDIKRAFRRGRSLIDEQEKDHPWLDRVESFELDREIRLVISSDDPNFFDNKKSRKATVATMRWTGRKFTLRQAPKLVIGKMGQ